MAGYSGTPLPKKLGLEPRQRLRLVHPPPNLDSLLGPLPDGARAANVDEEFDLALLFAHTEAELLARFATLHPHLSPRGMLWVAWPKKAARFPTDLTEDRVRAVGLRAGLVDVKVCAIDDFWSGLKFVRRRAIAHAAE